MYNYKNGESFSLIKIVDNFFDEETFKNIRNYVSTKVTFETSFFEKDAGDHGEKSYGMRSSLSNHPELMDTILRQSEKKFRIKINKINGSSGVDMRNLKYFIAHTDPFDHNIMIMLVGPEANTNGTVFYSDLNNTIDTHVGFRENRAIMFPSDLIHSAHASNNPSLVRITSTVFIEEYEEV